MQTSLCNKQRSPIVKPALPHNNTQKNCSTDADVFHQGMTACCRKWKMSHHGPRFSVLTHNVVRCSHLWTADIWKQLGQTFGQPWLLCLDRHPLVVCSQGFYMPANLQIRYHVISDSGIILTFHVILLWIVPPSNVEFRTSYMGIFLQSVTAFSWTSLSSPRCVVVTSNCPLDSHPSTYKIRPAYP